MVPHSWQTRVSQWGCRAGCTEDMEDEMAEGEKDLTWKGLLGQTKELELRPGGTENSCIHLFNDSFIQHIFIEHPLYTRHSI